MQLRIWATSSETEVVMFPYVNVTVLDPPRQEVKEMVSRPLESVRLGEVEEKTHKSSSVSQEKETGTSGTPIELES